MRTTRIILTVGGIGKTTADKMYENVYDFDKHTLDYKWHRDGFEHLTDEEFKGVPGRIEKIEWMAQYIEDFCSLVDSKQYDVVTSYLMPELVETLLDRGYNIEIILLNIEDNCLLQTMKQRALNRGNSLKHTQALLDTYAHTLERFGRYHHNNLTTWVFDKPLYLSNFLINTGVTLIPSIL